MNRRRTSSFRSPDEGHGFVKKENQIKGYKSNLDFLDHYLKPRVE